LIQTAALIRLPRRRIAITASLWRCSRASYAHGKLRNPETLPSTFLLNFLTKILAQQDGSLALGKKAHDIHTFVFFSRV
jgi:hypothetical protein